MQKKSVFQMAIFGFFAFAIVASVMIFASVGGIKDKGVVVGDVLIWGTFDAQLMEKFLERLSADNDNILGVDYLQKRPETFDADLLNALASGIGPDLIIIDQSKIVHNAGKLKAISYDVLPKRTFKDTFIEEAELFLGTPGSYALPFSADPLVLYWNRDLLSENGYATPPKYWDKLFIMVQKINRVSESKNIEVSGIALGEFENINNAKDILSALIMQVGGNVIVRTEQGQIIPVLTDKPKGKLPATQTALRFFTEFANPAKNHYSWNRSMPMSRDVFAAGNLALYIGYAGELPLILAKNPHLNFDIAELPQIRTAKRKMTFGKVYGLAVPQLAPNPSGARNAAFQLANKTAAITFAELSGMPSVRRDILAIEPEDPLQVVFKNSVLIMRGFLDPNPSDTARIFKKMIESTTSGSSKISDAISRAQRELEVLIGR